MPATPTPNPPPQGGGEQQGEGDDSFPAWPDLVLIDGGKGQLDAARQALAEIGVADVPLVAIAKGRDRDAGRETFFLPGKPPIKLPPRDPALYFVQRLRDEAHRFAITYHRAERGRIRSRLDSIPGVGDVRRKALLRRFGSVAGVAAASVEELSAVPGVGPELARAILDALRDA
jgi:excinuclease ABC subunit C